MLFKKQTEGIHPVAGAQFQRRVKEPVMLEASKILTKTLARMEVLDGKTMPPAEWIQELCLQVVLMGKICLQQQGEIDKMKGEIYEMKRNGASIDWNKIAEKYR